MSHSALWIKAMQSVETYQLLTKKQAARYLNVSEGSIERLMRSGLQYIKVGGLVRFRPDDLAAYLESNACSCAGLRRIDRPQRNHASLEAEPQ
jgi:excisionase family DNA binding protein